METKQLKFAILGVPFAKQSARHTRTGHCYQTKKVIDGERNIRAQIVNQLPEGFVPWTGPVRIIKIMFIFPRPQNHFGTGRNAGKLKDSAPFFVTTKPDLTDNLMKGLCDAMNGVVFLDDKQVALTGQTMKVYGKQPRIEVEIEEMSPEKEFNIRDTYRFDPVWAPVGG